MRTARLAMLSVLGAGITLALVGTSVAFAEPAGESSDTTQESTATHSLPDNASAVSDYWTSTRMEAAVELDIELEAPEKSEDIELGDLVEIAPTDNPETGAPWEGEGDVNTTAGRVFFSMDGQDASCSGNAVTSDNGSTVLTAGHCVKYQGGWHDNWVFVPGYKDGEAPYGEWPATDTFTTPQWEADEDMNYDVGAAVVEQVDGQSLTDAVGGQGLSFNGEYNEDMYAFGWPAADPYDGESFIYCSGPSGQDPLLTNDHSLPCDMTGGSSGGPWFRDFDEESGTGLQASVNSFGYNFLPDVMFGPYFGSDAEDLYNTAQAA